MRFALQRAFMSMFLLFTCSLSITVALLQHPIAVYNGELEKQ